MRVYLDSCVVIYDVEHVLPFAAAVRAARDTVPEAEFVVSDLVRLECMVAPLRLRHDELIRAYTERFAAMKNLSLDGGTYDLAAELRAEYRLKTPDALHVACAIRNGCDEVWTNDGPWPVPAERIVVRVVG